MRRVIALFVVTILLNGCFGSIGIAPNEMLANEYAYVVGKKLKPDSGMYKFVDLRSSTSNQWLKVPESWFDLPDPSSETAYFVQKIPPGQYVFEYSFIQQNLAGASGYGSGFSYSGSNVARLGVINLEPGKINYIGTINVELRQTTFTATGSRHQATPKVTYHEDEVKEILKKQYPQLAPDIDSKFVIQRLR